MTKAGTESGSPGRAAAPTSGSARPPWLGEAQRRRLAEPSVRRVLVWVVVLIAIAGVGLLAWNEFLKDRVIPKRWGVVEEGLLYRSGQLSPALVRRMLAEHGIQLVVDLCAEESGNTAQAVEGEVCRELGIERLRFPLSGDGTGDPAQYAGALAAMVKAHRDGKPVLVHCAAGTQRTGGAVYFYRVLVQKRPADAAYDEMLDYGVAPAKDKPLLDYIGQNKERVAKLLDDHLVPTRPPAPGERKDP